MPAALTRYRIAAAIVSVLLIVLVFVGVPLKYAADSPGVAKYVGLVHGMLFYPLFLITALDLGWRVKMPVPRLFLTMVLGTVPIASIWSEHQTTRWVQDRPEAPVLQDQGAI